MEARRTLNAIQNGFAACAVGACIQLCSAATAEHADLPLSRDHTTNLGELPTSLPFSPFLQLDGSASSAGAGGEPGFDFLNVAMHSGSRRQAVQQTEAAVEAAAKGDPGARAALAALAGCNPVAPCWLSGCHWHGGSRGMVREQGVPEVEARATARRR